MDTNDLLKIKNFINGEFSSCNKSIDSFDPATGHVWAQMPDSGTEEVKQAVASAKAAFPKWAETSISERSRLLMKVADLVESRLEEFAVAESRDQGKPLWLARTIEIPRVVTNFRHFAQVALSDTDMAISEPDKEVLSYTVQTPVGVVGVISPWNLPLYLLSFKLAPALIYGNTVVAKPSEFTSVTAWMLCEVFQQAGVPNGVLNIVFGLGRTVGETLVRHPDVRLVSFTGSTLTGTHIAEVTAKQAKKLSLEMGGKNSAIVFEDADVDSAVQTLVRSSFLNSGQVCLCTSKIYIHRSIYNNFSEKFIKATEKLKVGLPSDPLTWLGPVANSAHFNKIINYLKIANQEGATVLTRSEGELELPEGNKQGYFLKPVVLTGLKDNSRCMQEEIFGPVTCLSIFDSDAEVIRRVNDVTYGLCSSIFSQNASRLHRVAPKLEVGTVWCNCWLIRNLHMPFGGAKMSGLGREGTKDSRDFYTEKKAITIKL